MMHEQFDKSFPVVVISYSKNREIATFLCEHRSRKGSFPPVYTFSHSFSQAKILHDISELAEFMGHFPNEHESAIDTESISLKEAIERFPIGSNGWDTVKGTETQFYRHSSHNKFIGKMKPFCQ